MDGLGFSLVYFEDLALFLLKFLELRYMPLHMDKDG